MSLNVSVSRSPTQTVMPVLGARICLCPKLLLKRDSTGHPTRGRPRHNSYLPSTHWRVRSCRITHQLHTPGSRPVTNLRRKVAAGISRALPRTPGAVGRRAANCSRRRQCTNAWPGLCQQRTEIHGTYSFFREGATRLSMTSARS